MQRWMRLANESEFVRHTGECDQCFDIGLNVEEIDFAHFRAPLLWQRRARGNAGDDFGLT